MSMRKRVLTRLATATVVGTLGVFASVATTASASGSTGTPSGSSPVAATTEVSQANSANWAGYVVGGKSFSSVSGTWTVPTASADPSSDQSYSATWLGLGGSSNQSQALEQAGTESDYVNGQPQYSAWYELLPAGQQKLNLTVHPGDKISTTVNVNGTTVTVSMTDQTTGRSITKTARMSNPDTSSAEWIVEAPAAEGVGGSSQILPLADFGKVTFTSATATADGHTGGIADSNWQTTKIQLGSDGSSLVPSGADQGVVQPTAFLQQSGATATTSSLSGDQFTVTWQDGSNSSQPAVGGNSPYGYGSGYGYGGYGYSLYGYGGYGYSPYGYGYTLIGG